MSTIYHNTIMIMLIARYTQAEMLMFGTGHKLGQSDHNVAYFDIWDRPRYHHHHWM